MVIQKAGEIPSFTKLNGEGWKGKSKEGEMLH